MLVFHVIPLALSLSKGGRTRFPLILSLSKGGRTRFPLTLSLSKGGRCLMTELFPLKWFDRLTPVSEYGAGYERARSGISIGIGNTNTPRE